VHLPLRRSRIIPRFHLDGVPPGSRVSVIKIDPESGERQGLIASAMVGDGGWVDLPQPIIVKAGEAFIAVPVIHQLTLLPDTFAICRPDADAAIPAWATAGDFFSITGTSDELSICIILPESRCIGRMAGHRRWRTEMLNLHRIWIEQVRSLWTSSWQPASAGWCVMQGRWT
jgi:hypothetical protein